MNALLPILAFVVLPWSAFAQPAFPKAFETRAFLSACVAEMPAESIAAVGDSQCLAQARKLCAALSDASEAECLNIVSDFMEDQIGAGWSDVPSKFLMGFVEPPTASEVASKLPSSPLAQVGSCEQNHVVGISTKDMCRFFDARQAWAVLRSAQRMWATDRKRN